MANNEESLALIKKDIEGLCESLLEQTSSLDEQTNEVLSELKIDIEKHLAQSFAEQKSKLESELSILMAEKVAEASLIINELVEQSKSKACSKKKDSPE